MRSSDLLLLSLLLLLLLLLLCRFAAGRVLLRTTGVRCAALTCHSTAGCTCRRTTRGGRGQVGFNHFAVTGKQSRWGLTVALSQGRTSTAGVSNACLHAHILSMLLFLHPHICFPFAGGHFRCAMHTADLPWVNRNIT
jgi:hypothetical protein